jgi:hypothetical protein
MLILQILLHLSFAASLHSSYADLALSSTSSLGCSGNFPYQCPNNPSKCCSGSTGCCDSNDRCSWSYTCGNYCQNTACTCSTDASCLATYSVYGATRFCCGGTCQSSVCPAPEVSPSPLPSCCSSQCGGSKNVCSGQCVAGITQCQCTGACTSPFTQCIENACPAGSTGLATTTIFIIVGACMGVFGVAFLIWYFSCRASRLSQGGVYHPAPQSQAYQGNGAYQQPHQAYHAAPQPGPQPAAQAPPLTFMHPKKEQQPLLAVGKKSSV